MSQSWETEVRLTGCGGHLLGRGCTFSLLIGSLPLLDQKTLTGVKRMEKEKAYLFLQAQNIYIRYSGSNAFADCKETVTAVNHTIRLLFCLDLAISCS
jgi:hypothetical protein